MDIVYLSLAAWFTSTVSGVFGMAGGVILMGFLAGIYEPAPAILLHGMIQGFANAHRAFELRHSIDWLGVFRFLMGACASYVVMRIIGYIPSQTVLYLMLGSVALIGAFNLLPPMYSFQTQVGALSCGFSVTCFQLMAGVAGPLLDLFFRNRNLKKEIVVSTKAMCQVFSHAFKVILMAEWTQKRTLEIPLNGDWISIGFVLFSSALGTWLGKSILVRLKQESFYLWTGRILGVIGFIYIGKAIKHGFF